MTLEILQIKHSFISVHVVFSGHFQVSKFC